MGGCTASFRIEGWAKRPPWANWSNNYDTGCGVVDVTHARLVEDDECNRTLIEDIFEFDCPDYRLVCTTTGEAVLELAEKQRPSLVLMDLGLPGMNGRTSRAASGVIQRRTTFRCGH